MADRFANTRIGRESHARDHFTLATGVQDPPARAFYCYASGSITVRARAGGDPLPYALTAGQYVPVPVYQVTTITSGTFYGWE